ncbi:MAG: glycine betaine ABC transporter substrate-binding protein [Solirubrobacteraceae bacterium]
MAAVLRSRIRFSRRVRTGLLLVVALGLGIAGCGTSAQAPKAGASAGSTGSTGSAASGGSAGAAGSTGSAPATGAAGALPGAGRPQIMLGDKNFTEQFVLGELYRLALQAQGFSVVINRNIGPTAVTIQALQSGRIDVYPEYLGTWNTKVVGDQRTFQAQSGAYRTAQRYALAHGLQLLAPTPFSDTDAIAVTPAYAAANGVHAIGDLQRLARALTLGGPPQFAQLPAGLPALEHAYGFTPAAFKALDIGAQYPALDDGTVQAADVNTTDGQLIIPDYELLSDPRHVFGWGNVVPVVPTKVLAAEGPALAATINKVDSLLSTSVMRALNAAVDLSHQDPALVAKQFLLTHGVIAVGNGSSAGP